MILHMLKIMCPTQWASFDKTKQKKKHEYFIQLMQLLGCLKTMSSIIYKRKEIKQNIL